MDYDATAMRPLHESRSARTLRATALNQTSAPLLLSKQSLQVLQFCEGSDFSGESARKIIHGEVSGKREMG